MYCTPPVEIVWNIGFLLSSPEERILVRLLFYMGIVGKIFFCTVSWEFRDRTLNSQPAQRFSGVYFHSDSNIAQFSCVENWFGILFLPGNKLDIRKFSVVFYIYLLYDIDSTEDFTNFRVYFSMTLNMWIIVQPNLLLRHTTHPPSDTSSALIRGTAYGLSPLSQSALYYPTRSNAIADTLGIWAFCCTNWE